MFILFSRNTCDMLKNLNGNYCCPFIKMDILPCTSQQLNLDVVLSNGQSFRWSKIEDKNGGPNRFVGVARHTVWKIWRERDDCVQFKVLGVSEGECPSVNPSHYKSILEDYFQLHVNVEDLYKTWSSDDTNFRNQINDSQDRFRGVRILKQDVVETLFAFICSANNNISRISGLVRKLCHLYGIKFRIIDESDKDTDDQEFYDFPSMEQLKNGLPKMEETLRNSGFGYRAKYIADTVEKLAIQLGGEEWLESLRSKTYEEARTALMTLPGVGPKVADCICLMGLQKHQVVPVDTHVFQITNEFYTNEANFTWGKTPKKSLTKAMHSEIGNFYAERFGPYAGWAHSVLFSNRLRHLKSSK